MKEDERKLFNWKNQAVLTIDKDQKILWINYKKDDFFWTTIWEFKINWKKIIFDMPNFCAMYLDVAHKNFLESDKFLVFSNIKKFRKNKHEDLFNFIQKRISNVIFAFTWLEAFLNENIWAIENFDKNYRYKYINQNNKKITEKWINKIIDLFSIKQKVNVIQDFYEIKENEEINRKLKKITELRNKLVHFKRKDTISFNVWDWTIFNELLDKNFLDYSVLVYEIIDYFIKNSKKEKGFSAYWYKRPDNCFKK